MAEPAERLAEIERRHEAIGSPCPAAFAPQSHRDDVTWLIAEHKRLSEELAHFDIAADVAIRALEHDRIERDAMREVVEAARALRDCYHGMHGMECQHSVAVTDALARLDGASKVLNP